MKYFDVNSNLFPALIGLNLSVLPLGTSFSSIALALVAIYCLVFTIINKTIPKFNFALSLPLILYFIFVLSLLWTVDINLTIKGLGRTSAFIIIPLLFIIMPRFRLEDFHKTIRIFSFSNVIFALLFLITSGVDYIKTKSFTLMTYHELVSVLDLNSIYVSIYFLLSLCYFLSRTQKKTLDIFSIILLLNMIVLLSSKTVIITTILVLAIFGLTQLNKKKRLNLKTGLLITMVTILVVLSSRTLVIRLFEETQSNLTEILEREKFSRVYPWTGTSLRLFQLRLLSEQLKEDRIIFSGYGLFASRPDLRERHKNYNTYFAYHKYNYHNQYAQFLSETGVFSLLFLVFILAFTLYCAIRSKNFVFLVFSIMIPMIFLTESFLWVHRGIFFYVIIYCLCHQTNFRENIKETNFS